MNIAIARYNKSLHAVAEKRVKTDIPDIDAMAYLNAHPDKPLIAYYPELVDHDLFHKFGYVETEAYKAVYKQLSD